MASKSSYTPGDLAFGLAEPGEIATFEFSATNGGNVDIHRARVSNRLFKNNKGGCWEIPTHRTVSYTLCRYIDYALLCWTTMTHGTYDVTVQIDLITK